MKRARRVVGRRRNKDRCSRGKLDGYLRKSWDVKVKRV